MIEIVPLDTKSFYWHVSEYFKKFLNIYKQIVVLNLWY